MLAAGRAAQERATRGGRGQRCDAEALSDITATVANAGDDSSIAYASGSRLVEELHPDGVLIARSDPRGAIETVAFSHGYSALDIDDLRSGPDSESWSTCRGSRTCRDLYENADDFVARFPTRADLIRRFGARAWAVVPLSAADHIIGFMVVMFRTEHAFGDDERRFLLTVGDVVAQAMLRAAARVAEALALMSAENLAEAIAAEQGPAHRGAASHARRTRRRRRPLPAAPDPAVERPGGRDPGSATGRSRRRPVARMRPADPLASPAAAPPLQRALGGEDLAEEGDALVVRDDGVSRRVHTTGVPIRDARRPRHQRRARDRRRDRAAAAQTDSDLLAASATCSERGRRRNRARTSGCARGAVVRRRMWHPTSSIAAHCTCSPLHGSQ